MRVSGLLWERVVADLSGLTAAVAALVENQSAVVSRLSALEAQVATLMGSVNDQASVDALTAQVAGVNTALAAAVAPAPSA